jgi:hypothetical protein
MVLKWIIRRQDRAVNSGFFRLRAEISVWLLLIRQWTFGFRNIWGNSFVTERLAFSHEGLSSVLLVTLHPFQLSWRSFQSESIIAIYCFSQSVNVKFSGICIQNNNNNNNNNNKVFMRHWSKLSVIIIFIVIIAFVTVAVLTEPLKLTWLGRSTCFLISELNQKYVTEQRNDAANTQHSVCPKTDSWPEGCHPLWFLSVSTGKWQEFAKKCASISFFIFFFSLTFIFFLPFAVN